MNEWSCVFLVTTVALAVAYLWEVSRRIHFETRSQMFQKRHCDALLTISDLNDRLSRETLEHQETRKECAEIMAVAKSEAEEVLRRTQMLNGAVNQMLKLDDFLESD